MNMQRYLERTYLPQREMGAKCRYSYRHAVRLYVEFADDAALESVSLERLAGYAAHLRGRGMQPSTIADFVCKLRTLSKHRDPEIHQIRFPRPYRATLFEHSGEDGTLANAILNTYRRGRRIRSRRTVLQYSMTIVLFSRQLGRPARVDDLCSARVGAFLTWLVTDHRATRRTMANHSQRIGAMWRWAARNWLVQEDPSWI